MLSLLLSLAAGIVAIVGLAVFVVYWRQFRRPARVADAVTALPAEWHFDLEATAGGAIGQPDAAAVEALAAAFATGRYEDAAAAAAAMTWRFPRHAFGWKMLGAAFAQLGWSANAQVCTQRATELDPADAEAHSNLGAILQGLGQLDAALACYRRAVLIRPAFAEAHGNLGDILRGMGQLEQAADSYRRALALQPDLAALHCNLGLTLLGLGQLDAALASCRRALAAEPDNAYAHNALGDVLQAQGHADTAAASYRHALEIRPDFAAARYNLANALLALGQLDEAEANSRQALALEPDLAEAHHLLALILQHLGRDDEAEASYERALIARPEYPAALNRLAALQIARGKAVDALATIRQSLLIEESSYAKYLFTDCVKRLRWTQDNGEVRALMTRALREAWGRPNELSRAAANLTKCEPAIDACVTRAVLAWPQRLSARDLFGAGGIESVAADPLLQALLESAPVCDMEMERFLTMARHALLELAGAAVSTPPAHEAVADAVAKTAAEAANDAADPILQFAGALAQQCFINEYLYLSTKEEQHAAQGLRDALEAALAAAPEAAPEIAPLHLLTVAAYTPLHTLTAAQRLLDLAAAHAWPEAVAATLAQQVREPIEEQRLRGAIARLTPIDDEVSLLVQNQYEENPYPRWVKAAPAEAAGTHDAYLAQRFPRATLARHPYRRNVDILIAGCGTGQHPIQTAQQFPAAAILAIDLSMKSLAYAKRKTRELGIGTIDYAQADLLALGKLDRRFDAIESVGVLHHLADPWAGWRGLLPLLRQGGYMKLGFYSETARRNIVKARAEIAAQGSGASAGEIRRRRHEIADRFKDDGPGASIDSPDFYSISACRDLLFHVQEHRMTLTAIDAFLKENRLNFIGFELPAGVLANYHHQHPNDPAATDLQQWQSYEDEHPDTFVGMYQFWVQKVG